jgi:putative AlgH/UPF0301 family transcriptional regulator
MRTPTTHRQRLQGTLLVASPCKADHPLPGMVFLVISHDETGVAAVCLNDPTNHAFQRRCDEWINAGLSHKLLEELACNDESRAELAPWLSPYVEKASQVTAYTSQLYDNLEDAAAGLGKTIRLFVGRYQFANAEVEHQISQGIWLTVKASPELLFTDLSHMWEQTVRRAGEIALCEMTGSQSLYSEFAWN